MYDGEWLNGLQHGYGVHHWPDGEVYEGQWEKHQVFLLLLSPPAAVENFFCLSLVTHVFPVVLFSFFFLGSRFSCR